MSGKIVPVVFPERHVDVTPENWSSDYVSSYGGTYGEEEQILRG